MATLSLQQRAKRAASRRNKKIAQKYPLFAAQFSVTVESQAERLQAQERMADQHFEALHRSSIAAYKRAMLRRKICKASIPAKQFAHFDAQVQRIYGSRGKWSRPEHAGHFYADFWWQCVRDFVPSYAQTHCPNSQFHDWEIYQREGSCPTCGKALCAETKPIPVQLTLPIPPERRHL